MFKFKIAPGRVQALENKFRADMKKHVLDNAELGREVGQMLVDRLKYQARSKKPMNETGSFPNLKPATIKNREYLEKYNETHPAYSTKRANLTITGAFLESLTFKFLGRGKLEIFFQGKHPRYNGKNGPIGKEVSNQDLYGWLREKGFPTFDESIQQNKTLRQRIRGIVLSFIRRGLSSRK